MTVTYHLMLNKMNLTVLLRYKMQYKASKKDKNNDSIKIEGSRVSLMTG